MPGFRSQRGGSNLFVGLERLVNNVHIARVAVIEASALILVRQIKLELSTPGRGRLRVRGKIAKGKVGGKGRSARRSNISKLTRASAPGDAPAVDTGALRNSIAYERNGINDHRVGTGKVYGPPLEYGANLKHGGKILPRPFMRPAFNKVRDAMGKAARDGLHDAGRKSLGNN